MWDVIRLDAIGLALARRNVMTARIIHQALIESKGVGVVLCRLEALLDHVLHPLHGPLPDHIPPDNAQCGPIYLCDEVDPVFLCATKVNSSSSSAGWTLDAGCGRRSGRASACRRDPIRHGLMHNP